MNFPNLDDLYEAPSDRIQNAVLDRLIDVHRSYLEKASFFCLATGCPRGLDVSPRGGPPGFVRTMDEHTVAFADWPGNNRIESLRNLQQDDRMAMVFLFPGLDIFLRINGRGRISTEGELLRELSEGQRRPKTAIVVRVDEVLMHCGKAITRARLWQDSSRLERDALPTVGRFMSAISQLNGTSEALDEATITEVDAHYAHAVKNDLY